MKVSILSSALLSSVVLVNSEPNTAYVCSFCVMGLGLVEQAALQVNLETALKNKCNGSKICERAVEKLIYSIEGKGKPEDICAELELCKVNCPLFDNWPVDPLPSKPIEWPIERKLSETYDTNFDNVKLSELKNIFINILPDLPDNYNIWANIVIALNNLMFNNEENNKNLLNKLSINDITQLDALEYSDSCDRFNITCKITALVDHKPLQDHDQDRFSSINAKRLRGSDWRGYDCNDLRDDVYPGRKTYGNKLNEKLHIDHNCNGIYGGNTTGSYEDLFCSNSQQRGLVILGDSATAHFHVPPQWITANGWNLDQLLPDALNELDQPHCSWGTGHATLEECPYQYEVPGVNGIISLYTQLRDRNRCNHNDFQNIGVNGARMTSSKQLVDAMARDKDNDNPLLIWLALIGNDVCNGHPGFGHMTPPDEFYTKTMETLNQLDSIVPPNSHVVSLALFDGELLYATMHNHIHPVGTSYKSLYDFMNCLEENPCWGWLNSNATVRRETTLWSDSLNLVYQNISNTQSFKNFKYIYYGPKWMDLFNDYAKGGNPMTNLIEPTDGFHPSQAGNALFAKKFFEFLETEHPDAIGPINPYNAEIDAMFFNKHSK